MAESTLRRQGLTTITVTKEAGARLQGWYLIGPITVFGTEYQTVRDAAKALGVTFETVRLRLSKAYTAATKKHGTFTHPEPDAINKAFWARYIIVKGKPFRSATHAAQHFDIPSRYAASRLKKLTSAQRTQDAIDQIFDRDAYDRRKRRMTPFFAKGTWYPNQKAACRAHGVDQQTVIRKLRALDSPTQEQIDQLFDPPETHTRNPKAITVRDIEYPSVTAACRALGVSQSTVDARLKRIPERSPEWIEICFFAPKFPKV